MVNIVLPKREVVLPHYIRAHWSRSLQQYTYRWEINGKLKTAGFRPVSVKFRTDLERAIRVAEGELLPALRAFVANGHTIAVQVGPLNGSVDALVETFMRDDAFTSLGKRTRQSYRKDLLACANHVFRSGPYEGRRFGSLRVEEVTTVVTRQLLAEFSTKIIPGAGDDGKPLEKKRDGQANHSRMTYVTLWNSMYEIFPGVSYMNPFSKTKRRRYKKKRTVHATIEDLACFIMSARANGLPNLAIGLWFAYEFEMRVESIFNGGLRVEHYKPSGHSEEVLITHYKTGEEIWIRLKDSNGEPLYPGVEAVLDELKGDRTEGPLILRDGTTGAWAELGEQMPEGFYKAYRQVAGEILVKRKITPTSFRHGGITEGAEAGLTEFELMALSGHEDPRTVRSYIKRTKLLLETAQKKRLAHRSRVIESLLRRGVVDEAMLQVDGIREVIGLLPPVPKPEGADDSDEE